MMLTAEISKQPRLGAGVAMENADVVLIKGDSYDIVAAIELSRENLRKMQQNLWWAVGYNVIAFPLAAGVLCPFVLSPVVAALSMSGSSAVVAINALLLKRKKLAGPSARRAGQEGVACCSGNPTGRQEGSRGTINAERTAAASLPPFFWAIGPFRIRASTLPRLSTSP